MSDTEQPMTPGSSATAAPPATEVKFTEKEDRVLKVVFQCMRTVPEVSSCQPNFETPMLMFHRST